MKKLIALALLATLCGAVAAFADDNAFFKAGPLSLNIPLKTVRATYMYDFHASQNLVGGETPFISAWDKIEGDFGAVTSLEGQGTPFIGGNILIGNVLDKYVTLPSDLAVGGFGGWNFNSEQPIYGVKASVKIW